MFEPILQRMFFPARRCSWVMLLLAAVITTAGCRSDSPQNHHQQNSSDVGSILANEEAFTGFFTTEKLAIRAPKAANYLKARDAYFFEVFSKERTQQSPGRALEKMESWLKSHNAVVSGKEQAIEDALWLAGMELITDRSALAYEQESFQINRGIVFAEQPNKKVRLDLFLAKGTDTKDPVPCIICIHGGGFRVHRREWFAGHAARFAKAGFAAVTIDYRKEPGIESRLDPVLDAKSAVRWVRANAENYGIDPKKIGVFGGSAGAFLANSLATTAGVKELESSGGNLGVSSAVQAVVSCAGGCLRLDPPEGRQPDPGIREAIKNFGRERMEKFSPYQQVDTSDPPILILHAKDDKVVPLWQSQDLYSRYLEVGLSPKLEVIENQGHTFYLSQKTVDRAIAFFRKVFDIQD